MTKHPGVFTTNAADDFEPVSSDELTRTSGGWYGSGWYGNGGSNPGWYGGWQPQYHTVQPGDNLTNIARNAGYSLRDLLRMNPQFRQNPDRIYPGQHVRTGGAFPWR